MASQGRAKTLKNGLTQKQNAFTNEIIKQIAEGKQINATQAAEKVYDVKNKNIAHSIAAENLQKPTIQQVIEKSLNAKGGNADRILENVLEIANSQPKYIPAGIKLQANIEILKLIGKYPNTLSTNNPQVIHNQTINITYEQAKTKLAEISGNASEFIADAEAV